jgi:hypothetical protein
MTILETRSIRITCLTDSSGAFNSLAVDVRADGDWQRMAKTDPLSLVTYKDNDGNPCDMPLLAQTCDVDADGLTLRGETVDGDGVSWQLSVRLARTARPGQISADYRLETGSARSIYRWIGPSLLAGEESFGTAKDEALFPGLEYLLDDEPSSDTRFAAPKYANRITPQPYKITIPLMAISYKSRAVGLIWDANQDWGGAWRHPAALFSSPNRLNGDAQNHQMALFTPAVEPRWLNEGEQVAHTPYGIAPDRPSTLSARIVAVSVGGVIGVVREWVAAYGLPPLPEVNHDYQQNIGLTIESFLDIAWDEQAQGWHHTLADPWGARYETLLANQLWRYSRWSAAKPELRHRAQNQVRRAIQKHGAGQHISTLDLPLVYGDVQIALDAMHDSTRKLIDEQQADGSWGWTPAAVAEVADFKTEDRLAVMGKEQGSATGFTSSKVIPVMRYALATGDREAVQSVLKAADWCNTQRRPEGAQTWELHLHVPDVLAAPYLINLNLAAYQLADDANYLEQANRWAWMGLPFTFLWNGYYRPVMRYGTVPVFGVTFHDVQSWFGVIVHWNGLWYSDALFRLAKVRRSDGDGEIDWYHLAEGIVRHGMQEQIQHGPHKGMYPDAFSTVRGDEEYTWWLNPQLIGLNTLPLAGLPVTSETVVVNGLHITSGAAIVEAKRTPDATLHVLLSDQPNMTSYTLIAAQQPSAIACDGVALEQVDDLDSIEQGWQWLSTHQCALVKVSSPDDQPHELRFTFS